MATDRKPSGKRRQARQVVGASVSTPPTSTANSKDPNITFIRTENAKMRYKWDLVRDCLRGQQAIKEKGTVYLPMPLNDPDECERNLRYEAYRMRAQFYNFTRRTMDGLVGQVFSRDPILKGSPYLKKLAMDIDGAGTALDQQAKIALGMVLAYGRCGIMADYPARETGATAKEIQDLSVRPSIQLFAPWAVINWREKLVGGSLRYDLVVIQEQAESSADGFEISTTDQWRVLRMIDGVYTVEIWRKDELGATYLYSGTQRPTDADGNNLPSVPFRFIGSMSNDSKLDEPPLYDLAETNIGHYRNSADYEEASFMLGQPTLAISGLTKEWVEQVFRGTVYLGSRAAIPMPANAKAELLQVSPNTMPFEAMKHKEAQAVAMGAQLIRESGVQKTLGESQNDSQSNSSYLATCAKNVSAAYTWLLPVMQAFSIGEAMKIVDPESKEFIFYDLNTDFPATRMTPNERTQLIAEWMDGAITFEEMRDGLRTAGVATMDTEKAKQELAANPAPNQVKAENELKLAQAGLDQKAAADKEKAANQPQKPNNAPSGGNQAGN